MTVLEKNVVLEKQEENDMLGDIPKYFEKGGYQAYKIFLDRYTTKARKGDVVPGNLVIIVTKRDEKFPQKEVGYVNRIDDDGAWVDLWSGGQHYETFDLISRPLETQPEQVVERVARALSASENDDVREIVYNDFKKILLKDFIPGGRILAGAGVSELTLQNCFVAPNPDDSRLGALDSVGWMIETHARGGGVGINGSAFRPRWANVKGVNGISSGAVSWMKPYSVYTGLIEQGGSRRGATMLMMWDWHPDILEFIEAKSKAGEFENTNMSVCISDTFMEALKNDGMWNLIFPDTTHERYDEEWDGNIKAWKDKGYPIVTYDTIKARRIWDRLIECAWASAEPGLHFLDRSNKMSNSYYFAPLVATNPCGEQPLEANGVCTLGSIDLSRFVTDNRVDWDRLEDVIKVSVRFLDNVIDVNNYHLPEIKKTHEGNRRIGLGTMGLAEMMIRLGIRYGSDEGVAFTDELFKFFSGCAYIASAELAEEKGSFPEFNAEKFINSGYMKTQTEFVRNVIERFGMRNVCVLTQAPTGTTGTMVGTSTAGEPFYAMITKRTSRLGEHIETPYVIKDLGLDPNNLPDYCVTAMSLTPDEHLNMQAAMQRWIDSAISKTTNVPHDWTIEQTDELYRKAYDLGCKGITMYRDGSRHEQVLNEVIKDEPEDEDWIRQGGCLISSDGTVSKCDL
jgi:ribonucleoside-diphosphate reductase alpha chain